MQRKWVLEGFFGSDGQSLQRMPLKQFPAKVGRDPNLSLAIVRSEISRVHAEFFEKHGELFLRDLNSTNGTFINHQPLAGEMSLRHGDVVHFASYEVRVLEEIDEDVGDSTMTTMKAMPLSNKLPTGLHELQILLNERAIRAEFQPIVGIEGSLFGYEVLGRGSRADLPISPMELFRIAESMPGKDAQLSELMRDVGVAQGYQQSKTTRLFMNTHPAELKNTEYLMMTMRRLRESCPDLPMVLEIHEDAVTDLQRMKQVAAELADLDVELAYDDFGAGQTRLLEMTEVPVKYVKFDIALIRNLHNAPEAKQKMVAMLVAMTKGMGIQALAEGVEGPEELALCKEMNFDLIQGYYFSKPKPLLDYKNPLK
jgi:EAL domain-containing protein (putative c-di-GMP-specific phosphodiesterase class I)